MTFSAGTALTHPTWEARRLLAMADQWAGSVSKIDKCRIRK